MSGAISEDESDDAPSEDRVGALVDTDAGTLVDTHAGTLATQLAARLANGLGPEQNEQDENTADVPKPEPSNGHGGTSAFILCAL